MNARRVFAVLSTATIATFVGCSSPPPGAGASASSAASSAADSQAQATAVGGSGVDDEAARSRDAVAQQTARYAAEIEQALAVAFTRPAESEVKFAPGPNVESAERVRAAEVESSAKPQAEVDAVAKVETQRAKPTQVDWAELLKGAETERATQVAAVGPAPAPATVAPVKPASPLMAANVRASLDDMPEPLVVPEGEEIAPTVPPASAAKPTAAAQQTVVSDGPAVPSLDEQLEKRIAENPRDVAAHLDHQLRLYTSGASVPQLTSMASLPAEDREIVAALMDGLTNFRTAVGNDANAPLAKKVRPLVEVAERLKSQADLSVPTLALCRRVDGFGTYEPFDPATFPAGRASDAIIYAEVANFSSQKVDGKRWQTTLTQTATLYRDTGVPVLTDKTVEFVDHSRNRRNDFFVVKLLKLPATLSPGKYVLKVSIVDKQSSRMAEASMNLTIGEGEENQERRKLEMGKTE